MTLVRAIALAALLIAAVPHAVGTSQARPCADVAKEIAAEMRKRNMPPFTLTIVRPGDEAGRRVVGGCDDRERIVYEPAGSRDVVADAAATTAATPETAGSEPSNTPVPAATAPGPAVPGSLPVRHLDPSSPPRHMSRDQLESLRLLAVEQGADDRENLEAFAQRLKINALPFLSSGGGRSSDFVIVESDHRDPSSAFTMITENGKVILAERSSWLIGLLPEQHSGYFDLCLLSRDFPEPGASYSDWTVEFDSGRYVKKTREFKGKSCLDRVELKIAR